MNWSLHLASGRFSTGRVTAVFSVFFGLGVWVVLWAADVRREAWSDSNFLEWVVLALALTFASAFAFEIGVRSLQEIADSWGGTFRSRRVSLTAVAVILAASGVILATVAIPNVGGSVRGAVLCLVAVLGGAPTVLTFLAIGGVVRKRELQTPLDKQVVEYLRLRDLMARQLPPLGALVGLATLAFGAARLIGGELVDNSGPSTVVLIFGAVGTLFVALIYMFARHPMRGWARALTNLLTPTGGDPVTILEQRTSIAANLGLAGSVTVELQTGVWILAPLLAGALPSVVSS